MKVTNFQEMLEETRAVCLSILIIKAKGLQRLFVTSLNKQLREKLQLMPPLQQNHFLKKRI